MSDLIQSDSLLFIIYFFFLFTVFMSISILFLYYAHILLKIKGHYDGFSIILNFFTAFTSITTLVIKYADGKLPSAFLTVTLFLLMLSVALTTTSRLLVLRENRKNKKQSVN